MRGDLFRAGALIAAAFLVGVPALAADGQIYDKLTPQEVGGALQALGISYKIDSDPRGYPMIVVDTARFPVQQFNILFFSCDKVQAECDDITLWSWYNVTGASPKTISAWNDPFQSRRWSTGYIDQDNNPALIMNINATGGLGERNLRIMVNTYVEDLFDFRDVLKEQRTSENTSMKGASDVAGLALVDDDVLRVTDLIKEFGSASYDHVKEDDTKE